MCNVDQFISKQITANFCNKSLILKNTLFDKVITFSWVYIISNQIYRRFPNQNKKEKNLKLYKTKTIFNLKYMINFAYLSTKTN